MTTSASVPEQGGNQLPPEWTQVISPFAKAIGKSEEAVTAGLKLLVGDPSAEAAALLGNSEFVTFDDLKSVVGADVPAAVFRKAVSTLLRPVPEAKTGQTENAMHAALGGMTVALPSVPEDKSWLEMLKTGGVLKVDTSSVIAAIRAALASRTGLFDLPKVLADAMEKHAEGLEEPLGQDFFKLRKMLTRRNYAEIFAAVEGLDGNFVTEKRKNALLTKLNQNLWPSLLGFQSQLVNWTDAYQKTFANPGAMMAALAALGTGQAMPGGITQPPPTQSLRDTAEGVSDTINGIFAGAGIQVAAALAYDAMCVKEVLTNPGLPAQVGAPNREQMLKILGVNVSSDFVRLERNLTQYALAVLEFPNAPAGNQELGYLNSLLLLGGQIPWDKLGVPPRTTTAARRRSVEELPDEDSRFS